MIHQASLIRKIRYKYDLSQKQISDACGYDSAQFVSNVERGIANIPVEMAKVLIKKKYVDKADIKYAIINDFKEYLEGVL